MLDIQKALPVRSEWPVAGSAQWELAQDPLRKLHGDLVGHSMQVMEFSKFYSSPSTLREYLASIFVSFPSTWQSVLDRVKISLSGFATMMHKAARGKSTRK